MLRSPDVSIRRDRKSTRLNSSHGYISYAVFCLKKKKEKVGKNNASHARLRSEVRTHRGVCDASLCPAVVLYRPTLFLFPASILLFFFFNDTATTEIYTLSLHDALPI